MPQSASLGTQRKGASCNNTPCLGFITPLRNGNAHQKLGKLISAKDRIAAYLGKCRAAAKTNKLHKIAPRTGDSCQSLYLNWLPCITAKKRWILRHLVEMWNLLACTARWPLPEEPAVRHQIPTKSSPRSGPLKDSIPMPPACVIVVLSRISMPWNLQAKMLICLMVLCNQWPPVNQTTALTFRAQDPHNGAFAHPEPWLKAKLPSEICVKFQKLLTDTYEWQI